MFKTTFDALEIHKYLLADKGIKATISEILTILETDLKDKIQTSNGFYYLTGRSEISEQRLKTTSLQPNG